MAAGFQVFNSSGFLQIDQDHVSLSRRATGTVIPTANANGQYSANITLSNAETPILFLQNEFAFVAVTDVEVTGNSYTYRTANSDQSANKGYGWLYYDKTPNVQPVGSGIAVYDAGGRVTFSSDTRPLRILAATTAPNGSIQSNPAFVQYPNPEVQGQGNLIACLTFPRVEIIGGIIYTEGIKVQRYDWSAGGTPLINCTITTGLVPTGYANLSDRVVQGQGGSIFICAYG